MKIVEKTFAAELDYLKKIRGEDEFTILAIAVKKGIEGLFIETIEELFIEGKLSKKEAVKHLGIERVEDINYQKKALKKDVAWGLKVNE